MGPELLAAVVGPILGGIVSVVLWVGNRNAKAIDLGFNKLQTTIERVDVRIEQVDDRVDDLKEEISKTYVSNARFKDHIERQSDMQARLTDEVKRLRDDTKDRSEDFRSHASALRNDISEIKEMQWKTRLGLLDLIDRKLNKKDTGSRIDIWSDVEEKDKG